jgi:hypothetical protein
MAQKLTLARALNLRKHLDIKVKALQPIKIQADNGVFETKTTRRKISDDIDEVTVTTPKLSLADITKEYDQYAKELRVLDDAIQETNHTTQIIDYTPNEELAII